MASGIREIRRNNPSNLWLFFPNWFYSSERIVIIAHREANWIAQYVQLFRTRLESTTNLGWTIAMPTNLQSVVRICYSWCVDWFYSYNFFFLSKIIIDLWDEIIIICLAIRMDSTEPLNTNHNNYHVGDNERFDGLINWCRLCCYFGFDFMQRVNISIKFCHWHSLAWAHWELWLAFNLSLDFHHENSFTHIDGTLANRHHTTPQQNLRLHWIYDSNERCYCS